MPTIRERAVNLLADGSFTLADARALSPNGPLAEADKTALHDLFASGNVEGEALRYLGMTSAPSGGNSIFDKVKARLIDRAKSEIYKDRGMRVADFDIGSFAGVTVDFNAELHDPDSSLIKSDRYRQPIPGQHTQWATTGILVRPRAGFSGSIPIPMGPPGGTLSYGFSANASIGLSVLAPYYYPGISEMLDADARKRAIVEFGKSTLSVARNITDRLPFNAQNALDMKQGTLVTLRGKGSVAARASYGVGIPLAPLGGIIPVGADIVVGGSANAGIDVSIRVKRLDGNKVFVALNRIDSREIEGHVGFEASIGRGMSIGAPRVDLGLPGMGGMVIDKATGMIEDKVDGELNKWLSIDMRATHERSETEKELQSYILDLGQPKVKQAYDAMMKLDMRPLDDLARDRFAGVTYAKLDEQIHSKSNSISANWGPIRLLSAISKTTTRHGEFESTADGRIVYDRALLDKSYYGIASHLWLGDQDVSHELVTTQKNASAPETYYHMKYQTTGDRVTSKNDVYKFLKLADCLGALKPEHKGLANNERFLEKFGKTDRTVDVYFTNAAFEKMLQVPTPEVGRVFGQVYDDLERPSKGRDGWERDPAPWMNKSAPDYQEAMKTLETGDAGIRADEMGGTSPEQAYAQLTGGRDLRRDRDAALQCMALAQLFYDLRNIRDNPRRRIEEFARANGALGLDFAKVVGTIARIAGAENVLVSELAIKDSKRDRKFVLAREGEIQDIDDLVGRALAEPT